MRQAGRYLPEYRLLRGEADILHTCKDPETVVELTLQPLRRMHVDAAILFSDIMVPLAAVGVPVRIEPGRGPIVDAPLRDEAAIARLRGLEPESDVPEVLAAIGLLRDELHVPLIGFAGGPFTLASYLVEGGPSRNHERTKALMVGDPATWGRLMDAIVDVVVPHLRAQVAAGAAAVQLFDSWIGTLETQDYVQSVLPHTKRVLEALADLDVPLIHFGVGADHLLEHVGDAGANVVGVDWRTPIDEAWGRVGAERAMQGNLDPAILLAPWPGVERKACDVLDRVAGRDGHIFNLGHGVLPATDPGVLARLVDLVHERSVRAEVPDA
jgi:uroporphyrinogen decarboxylase